jgi:hypothetical protein
MVGTDGGGGEERAEADDIELEAELDAAFCVGGDE